MLSKIKYKLYNHLYNLIGDKSGVLLITGSADEKAFPYIVWTNFGLRD